jgi:hypothetical protein
VYFFSHEPNEHPHVHVDRDDLSAKLVRTIGIGAQFGVSTEGTAQYQGADRRESSAGFETTVLRATPASDSWEAVVEKLNVQINLEGTV